MCVVQQVRLLCCKIFDQLFEQLEKGEIEELLFIFKGDGVGLVEVFEDVLVKIDVGDEVDLCVIDCGVGVIIEINVLLVVVFNVVIVGFNVCLIVYVQCMVDEENVDIWYYLVIYDVIDEIEVVL